MYCIFYNIELILKKNLKSNESPGMGIKWHHITWNDSKLL